MMEGMDTAQSRIDEFQKHRDRLFALAYRMLGLRSNTEDILQEASMQWMQLDGDEIRSPGRYLTRVVTNLCLDELRSASWPSWSVLTQSSHPPGNRRKERRPSRRRF